MWFKQYGTIDLSFPTILNYMQICITILLHYLWRLSGLVKANWCTDMTIKQQVFQLTCMAVKLLNGMESSHESKLARHTIEPQSYSYVMS